jgi:uncharacterized protein YbaP (TraB family)
MRLLPIILIAMLSTAIPVQAQNGMASEQPEIINLPSNRVEVIGVLPGPSFWRVSKGDHNLWILGTVKPIPKKMQWETIKLERKLAESQVLIAPPSVNLDADVGFFSKLGLIPSLLKARKNPDGKTLQQILPKEVYARWQTMKFKYIGNDNDVENWRPIFAAQELYDHALKKSGLENRNIVWPIAKEYAEDAKLPIIRPEIKITIANPKKFIKEFNQNALSDTACFVQTLNTIERDVKYMQQRSALWAEGKVSQLRQISFTNQSEACLEAILGSGLAQKNGWGNIQQRTEELWLQMVEQALAKNVSSVAVINMADLIKPNGYLAQLQAKGYSVQEPIDNP